MSRANTRFVYFIEEVTTGAYCTSSKFRHFGRMDDAAIFNNEANAEKAIRSMLRDCKEYPEFYIDEEVVTFDKHEFKPVKCYIQRA